MKVFFHSTILVKFTFINRWSSHFQLHHALHFSLKISKLTTQTKSYNIQNQDYRVLCIQNSTLSFNDHSSLKKNFTVLVFLRCVSYRTVFCDICNKISYNFFDAHIFFTYYHSESACKQHTNRQIDKQTKVKLTMRMISTV